MNGFTGRRAVTFASCLLIMGQSQHCSKEEYVDYQVRLQSCPDEGFRMPDSVVDGEFKLYSSDREVRPQCPGFKLYDYHEDRKGLAVPDVVRPDVRVRFERGESCRLYIYDGSHTGIRWGTRTVGSDDRQARDAWLTGTTGIHPGNGRGNRRSRCSGVPVRDRELGADRWPVMCRAGLRRCGPDLDLPPKR
jgi:hypothetical protein